MTEKVQMQTTGSLNDHGYHLAAGDRVTVPLDLAQYWAAHGWAEPVEANSEVRVHPRSTDPVNVNVDHLKHLIRTPEN